MGRRTCAAPAARAGSATPHGARRPQRAFKRILVDMWRVAALVAVISGGFHVSDAGDVMPAAREYLDSRYTPDVEHGYCITKWHKATDSTGHAMPVVDEVVAAANERENTELGVQFDCGTMPTLHTHPPRFPTPSGSDIAKGIVRGGLPFIVIQSGRDTFNFWVVDDRL